MTITTVCISTFRRKPVAAGFRLWALVFAGFSRVARVLHDQTGHCHPRYRCITMVEHDLFGKPAPTFPDHAVAKGSPCDRKEIGCFQACAADKRAIDVGNPHQFGGIRGLYRAAVENADLGPLLLKSAKQGFPDKAVNLLDVS